MPPYRWPRRPPRSLNPSRYPRSRTANSRRDIRSRRAVLHRDHQLLHHLYGQCRAVVEAEYEIAGAAVRHFALVFVLTVARCCNVRSASCARTPTSSHCALVSCSRTVSMPEPPVYTSFGAGVLDQVVDERVVARIAVQRCRCRCRRPGSQFRSRRSGDRCRRHRTGSQRPRRRSDCLRRCCHRWCRRRCCRCSSPYAYRAPGYVVPATADRRCHAGQCGLLSGSYSGCGAGLSDCGRPGLRYCLSRRQMREELRRVSPQSADMQRRARPRDVVNCQLLTGNDRVERVALSALRKRNLAEISAGARSGAPESVGRRHRSCGKWPSDDPSPSAL